jgi:hypothetical protein
MDKLVRHFYSKEERQKILEKTGCKCGHCGKELETATMTVEHIFPIAKGGNDDEFNLVALCKTCNYNKGSWVYKVDEYYKYILPEYMRQYVDYNDRAVSTFKRDRLVNFDAVTYSIVPDKYKELIYNMVKRKAKKKQIEQTVERLTMKVIMDRAFEGDAEEIREAMTASLSTVSTMLITYAARNSDFDGRDIREGDYLALYNGALLDTNPDISVLIRALAEKTKEDGKEFVNIFYGEDIREEDAQSVAGLFENVCTGAEVTLLNGGQPVYYYMISAE